MIITLQTLIFFRESLLMALDRLLRPYYNRLSLALGRKGDVSDDEEADEQVFAEYDDERGVIFYPPMYLQRYAAVSDCLMDGPWTGKLEKVVDLGYHDMSFIKYLKEVQGIKCILGVDLETIPLRCSMDLIGCDDYVPKREKPLDITLFKGNAADPDYRLIGCDAVIAIEMIEHMLPHDLDRLIHTVFGFIKPWVAIFTTPNGDFNVLFKSMEKNGLRRLDHFFEWSRDQFHDWCSNIVVRYPQYTVSCKGIGPGPNGTNHLGCCSQMAVFVAKEYVKQQDLDLNSLALVADTPSPHSISNLISSWETCEIPNESNMIEPPKNVESYSELRSNLQSSITIYLSSSSNSDETIPYQDKVSQCNLDSETEKGFLMFDYKEMCYDLVEPNRMLANHKVYDIEDVYNRLNCTTLEVKKFSKATQNLMAKNKVDTLVHTREVVDEIKHLTRMLNFNKDVCNQLENGTHTWCNINWGDNAPYWNQYYKIVKAYNYPFEVKSEECRILDLISDEINRLIDSQIDEDSSLEVSRMEIPIERLMREVAHITHDVDKVKDILEWNGYELQGEVVVHSRLVVDYSSAATQEDDSLGTSDIYSDWDSTSISDGSTTIVPDYNGSVLAEDTGNVSKISTARCLRRALDQKVRRLRSMLTADEDITTELDRVVCRLMKLALRSSKGRNTPPPTRWMQCKLLDLLTLTEKTIERRKRHFIESYELKTIDFEKSLEMAALERIKEDDTALKIVDKYKHLVNETEGKAAYRILDFEIDGLTDSSSEYAKDYEIVDKDLDIDIPDLIQEDIGPDRLISKTDVIPQEESKLERTQAWLEEEIEVVPYPIHDGIIDNSSVETEHIATNITKYYKKKYKGKQCIELNCMICKKTHSKTHKHHRKDEKIKTDKSITKFGKKTSRKSSHQSLGQYTHKKYVSVDYKTVKVKSRRKQKNLYPGLAKPVSVNHVQLCQPENIFVNKIEPSSKTEVLNDDLENGDIENHDGEEQKTDAAQNDVAATNESMFVEIITENSLETIALRRAIGTDADIDTMVFEDEKLIRSVSNTVMHENNGFIKNEVPNENIDLQTVFLYNLDEPTTSKGIRHVSMDVQCGPDTCATGYSILSATSTTSLTRVPKMYSAGIKIGNSTTHITSADFGTSTYDGDNNYRILHGNRSVGIKIKDSDVNLLLDDSDLCAIPGNSKKENTATPGFRAGTNTPEYIHNICLPRAISVGIKIKDSTSNISLQEGSISDHYFINPVDSMPPKEADVIPNPEDRALNLDCTLSTQEMYDKIIVTSQELFEKDADMLHEAGGNFERKESSHILAIRPISPIMNKNASFTKVIKKPGTQKKTVEFQLQNPVPEDTEPVNSDDIKNTFDTINASIESPIETITLIDISEKPEIACDSDLYLVPITELPDSMPCLLENNDEAEKEITNLKPYTDLTNVDSTTHYFDNVENVVANVTMCNSNLQAVSILNNTEKSKILAPKYRKQKLSNGGVQVYSYKDQQGLSEDMMCQGQWQKKNKVLNKRKCMLPVTVNKNDTNNKKLRALTKTSILKENTFISIKDKSMLDNNLKKDEKESVPFKVIHSNVKSEQPRKITKTACAAIVAKPFRNILKAPATFPVSRLPSKNLKSPFIVKTSPLPPASPQEKDEKPQRRLRKNYIPAYLRRRVLNASNKDNKTDLKLNPNPTDSEIKSDTEIKNKQQIPKLIRSKTEEINSDLIKFKPNPKKEYVVYRNEIEKKDKLALQRTPECVRKKDATRQRSSSAISTNSSTCSSPSSVATVKAVPTRPKNAPNRRHSGPSYVNSTDNSGSENSTPERNKKYTRRIKSTRVTVENKENIPETSKLFNVVKKDSEKLGKANYNRQKNVYMTQVKDSSIIPATNALSKTNNQITNSSTIIAKSHTDIKSLPDSTIPLAVKSSVALDAPLSPSRSNGAVCSQTSNMVVIIEPQPRQMASEPINFFNNSKPNQSTVHDKVEDSIESNHSTVSDKVEDSLEEITIRHSTPSIHSQMKEMVEESLDFIDDPLDDQIDTQTIILRSENTTSADDLPASPASFKTVLTSHDNYVNELLPADIEYALNQTIEANFSSESAVSLNDTRMADFDTMSFKSVTSGSKLSGYLSADNEFSSSIRMPKCTNPEPACTSVRDIFERKEQPFQPSLQTTTGAIANQVFSGFTINEEAISGDQPELIRLIDPVTGSLEAITRQATSEELLVSGRSSSSFDSCVLDEGAVVPNWLFQIISQQQSGIVDLDHPAEVIVQVPIGEPLFDDNGNIAEAPGANTGAGDGRGIHSDHSQDSSGQGTSVSSSDTSSGPQSQALLIDPAAFAAQFELLRESVDGSITLLAVDNADHSDNRQAGTEIDQQSFSRGEPPRTRAELTSASDVDADISSLETDEDPHNEP